MKVRIFILFIILLSCGQKKIYKYSDGAISEIGRELKDGTNIGKWIYYIDYPTPFAIEYRNLKGERKREIGYFSNGVISSIQRYKNNVRSGKQQFFYITGEDSLIFYCRQDTTIIGTVKVYSKDGEVIKEY